MQEKLCALVELLELQPGELAQVLRRSPSLLNRDVESLRPQLQTLLQHLRDPGLVSAVVRSYSQVLFRHVPANISATTSMPHRNPQSGHSSFLC